MLKDDTLDTIYGLLNESDYAFFLVTVDDEGGRAITEYYDNVRSAYAKGVENAGAPDTDIPYIGFRRASTPNSEGSNSLYCLEFPSKAALVHAAKELRAKDNMADVYVIKRVNDRYDTEALLDAFRADTLTFDCTLRPGDP